MAFFDICSVYYDLVYSRVHLVACYVSGFDTRYPRRNVSYRLDTSRLAGFPCFIFPSVVRQLRDFFLFIYMGSIELVQYLCFFTYCLGSMH